MDPLTVFMASLFGALVSDALRTRRSLEDFYPKSASRELEPHQGWISMRDRGVRWFVEPGSAVWIESRYLRPIPGNIFDRHKLGAVAKAVKEARRSGEPVPMYAGYGQVHRLTPEWIAESLTYRDDDAGPPFTTGDKELDDWLVRFNESGYGDKRTGGDPEEDAEMKERLALAELHGQGDLGKWTATVRDGNHRTFGAVLGGEEKVAIRLYDNDEQDLREMSKTLFRSDDPRRQSWASERRDLLLKSIEDTGSKPYWLDEDTCRELFRLRGIDRNKETRARGEPPSLFVPHLERAQGKTFLLVEDLGRVAEVRQGLLVPIGKGKDEAMFPEGLLRDLHSKALEETRGPVEAVKPDLDDFEALLLDEGLKLPTKAASKIEPKDVDKLIASAEQKGEGPVELAVDWLLAKGVPPHVLFAAKFALRHRWWLYPTVIDLLPTRWQQAIDAAVQADSAHDAELFAAFLKKFGIEVEVR